ncbi:MAG: molybdopterin-dependent oxidoreductase [Nitrososphaerota archaeon]|nr:molybdopterin-dependent oxidoreductase [Nitrososphaerota archaeon]
MQRSAKSLCRGCGHSGCGVVVQLSENGNVKSIVGDPSHPVSHGYICVKSLASIDIHNHPDRLRYPLKKEDGKWRRISWDEALDMIASKFKQIVNESGPEAVGFIRGTGRHYIHFFERFCNVFGSPNRVNNNHMCYMPRVALSKIFGFPRVPVVDYFSNPACIMLWGANPVVSNPDEYVGINLQKLLNSKAARFIVIDPRQTRLSDRADIRLRPRPGSDYLVALSMLNVIISEGLYDRDFVENYCTNFEALADFVKAFSPEMTQQKTWVKASDLRDAARLYARTKPAAIHWGVAIEQSMNCTGSDSALMYLVALTGNLDVQGGNVFFDPPRIVTQNEFIMKEMLSPEIAKKRIGGEDFKLLSMIGRITPYFMWNSILNADPYKIRAVLCAGSNPLVVREETKLVRRALGSLEFFVVIDLFMTPTAELADIVLPSATWLECNCIGDYWKEHGFVFPQVKVVEPPGEAWSDMKIFNELAKRLGLGKYFWNDVEESLDYILAPSGMKWEDFVRSGQLRGPVRYQKYKTDGFKTRYGKFDFWPETFRNWGLGPLPEYQENAETPFSKPEMAKDYPLILITGVRTMEYFNSEFRNLSRARSLHPYPLAEIHPLTAKGLGIEDGDWIAISTPRASIKQVARLTNRIDPRVVSIEQGWWYPELEGLGWDLSSANALTSCQPSDIGRLIGSTNLKGLLCKVEKTDPLILQRESGTTKRRNY